MSYVLSPGAFVPQPLPYFNLPPPAQATAFLPGAFVPQPLPYLNLPPQVQPPAVAQSSSQDALMQQILLAFLQQTLSQTPPPAAPQPPPPVVTETAKTEKKGGLLSGLLDGVLNLLPGNVGQTVKGAIQTGLGKVNGVLDTVDGKLANLPGAGDLKIGSSIKGLLSGLLG